MLYLLCNNWYVINYQKIFFLYLLSTHMLGIPIFLLCLANISGVLGEMFRFLYAKIICAPCAIYKQQKAFAKQAKIAEETGGMDGARTGQNGWSVEDNQHGERQVKSAGKRPINTVQNHTPMEDDDHQGRNQRVTVPLTITMLIIAGYIAIGAFIFHKFEDWTMTQAGYFCFITLGMNI